MNDTLRQYINKRKTLKKVLSFIYWKVVEPLISGYVFYMIYFALFVKSREVAKLKKLGFSKIHAFLSRSWRRGNEADHAHRRYYIAMYNQKKVFVKIAQNDSTIDNEIMLAETMRGLSSNHIIPAVYWSREFGDDRRILAVEFVEGLRVFGIPESSILFEKYCKEYLSILEFFQENNIVHADVHPKNLMIDCNDELKILDFGISGIIRLDNGVDYCARPGTYFREEGNRRIYDDAYSFIKMCEQLKIPPEYMGASYMKIKDRVGLFVLEVQI